MRGSLGDRDVVIGTTGIGTGGIGPSAESSQQARPLIGDGLVALEGGSSSQSWQWRRGTSRAPPSVMM